MKTDEVKKIVIGSDVKYVAPDVSHVNGVNNEDVSLFDVVGDIDVVDVSTDGFHVNNYTTKGVYRLKGDRLNSSDGLPINNASPGHTIDAKLTVLDSSINDNELCVTQVLTISNRVGGDGGVYTRTAQASSRDAFASDSSWEPWAKLQGNIEVGQTDSLDSYIDNGVYSGFFTAGYEAFVMVVINNYFAVEPFGVPRSVSQFKYSLGVDGTVSYQTRVGTGNDSLSWGDWTDLGGGGSADAERLKIYDSTERFHVGSENISSPVWSSGSTVVLGYGVKIGAKANIGSDVDIDPAIEITRESPWCGIIGTDVVTLRINKDGGISTYSNGVLLKELSDGGSAGSSNEYIAPEFLVYYEGGGLTDCSGSMIMGYKPASGPPVPAITAGAWVELGRNFAAGDHASIGDNARIEADAYVGADAYIGNEASVGDKVKIQSSNDYYEYKLNINCDGSVSTYRNGSLLKKLSDGGSSGSSSAGVGLDKIELLNNDRIGPYVSIYGNSAGQTKLFPNYIKAGNIEIGDNTVMNGNTTIGRNVSIPNNTTIDHDLTGAAQSCKLRVNNDGSIQTYINGTLKQTLNGGAASGPVVTYIGSAITMTNCSGSNNIDIRVKCTGLEIYVDGSLKYTLAPNA